MIKLLIGGSPCTYWSIAQKNNRETTAEGMGWEKHQVHGYCARKGVICVNDAACEHYIRGEWKDRISLRAQAKKSGEWNAIN